ncbi:phage tail protein [Nocardioides sp. 1609]|uniref:phage tail protein n=1 Tax=Nocardioides sp. 1609 TaxID=2508327 RepID=UPI0010704167|nr:phage tail protein [Nocardioides sp. 1609]
MSALVKVASAGLTRPRTPRRPDDWMLRQLPVQMLSHDFFVRFVSIFQELGSTLLEDADGVEHAVDLTIAPESSIAWLGSWIGVDKLDNSMPEALRRRIVATAARTLSTRGTVAGLTSFLELLSGSSAEVVEGGGIWRAGEVPDDTAWVRMRVARTGSLDEAAFVDMVRDEIPAHVTAELWVADRQVWNSEQDEEW